MNNFLEVSEEKVNEQREEQGAGENHPFGLVASEVSVGSVSLFANPTADAESLLLLGTPIVSTSVFVRLFITEV